MSYSLNGFGTTFYGKRDFRADGTFLTTEWVVFSYFPIVPIRSIRVQYRGVTESRIPIGLGSTDSYAVYEKTKPNKKQVICTYSYAFFVLLWFFAVLEIGVNIKDADFALPFIFISILLPIPIPWILRRCAKSKLLAKKN